MTIAGGDGSQYPSGERDSSAIDPAMVCVLRVWWLKCPIVPAAIATVVARVATIAMFADLISSRSVPQIPVVAQRAE